MYERNLRVHLDGYEEQAANSQFAAQAIEETETVSAYRLLQEIRASIRLRVSVMSAEYA